MAKKFVLKEEPTETAVTNSEELQEEVNGNIITEPVNFTGIAYSLIEKQGNWFVVEIPIDPVTMKTGDWKIINEDGSKMAAIERFKINVATTLL
jgi:hypothetical protein